MKAISKYILLLLFVSPAHADLSNVSIDVYGFSYHPTKRVLNEENYGLGLRYAMTNRTFINAGAYNDSLDGTTSYIGGGYRLPVYGPISLVGGLVVMHQTAAQIYFRQNGRPFIISREEQTLIAPVGALSIKTGNITTNFGYLPEKREVSLYETYFVFWTVSR